MTTAFMVPVRAESGVGGCSGCCCFVSMILAASAAAVANADGVGGTMDDWTAPTDVDCCGFEWACARPSIDYVYVCLDERMVVSFQLDVCISKRYYGNVFYL